MLLLIGMKANTDRKGEPMRHAHEWVPNEDGYYECPCGAAKRMSVDDARALWGEQEIAREHGTKEGRERAAAIAAALAPEAK